MNRTLHQLTAIALCAAAATALTACTAPATSAPASEIAATVPTPSDETAHADDGADPALADSGDYATSALLMELAIPETWTREWYADICGSVAVGAGDPKCVDRAAKGAILAHRLVDRAGVLLEQGLPVEGLLEPAEAGRAAGEAFFAGRCDRTPTPDCVGPTDDVVDALRDYASAVEAIIGAR